MRQLQLIAHGEPSDVIEINTVSEHPDRYQPSRCVVRGGGEVPIEGGKLTRSVLLMMPSCASSTRRTRKRCSVFCRSDSRSSA